MASHRAPQNTLPQDFHISKGISGDRKTNRVQIVIPKGWRFNSLNTSEGKVRLSFKRGKPARKAGRATGYALDRQRLIRS